MSNHPTKVLEQELKNLEAEKHRIIATIVTPYDNEIEAALKLIKENIRQTKGALFLLNTKTKAA